MTAEAKTVEGWRVRLYDGAVEAALLHGDSGFIDFEIKLKSSRKGVFLTFEGKRDVEVPLRVLEAMVELKAQGGI